ncbi:TolC family protein [Pandoraea pneumonica]|nr:TolC family protein [Pandoraea pneumonica]
MATHKRDLIIRLPSPDVFLKFRRMLIALTLLPGLACAQFLSDQPPPTIELRVPGTPTCSEIDLSAPLDYVTALNAAVCVNPKLAKAAGIVAEQAAGRRKAIGAYLPTVSLNVNASRFGKSVSYPGYSAANYGLRGRTGGYDATISWLLYDFGVREANLESASHMLNASVWEERAVVREMAESIASAFFKARAAMAASRAAQDAERSAQANLATAVALLRQGVGTLSDRLLAESAYEQAVLHRIDADSESRTANATLAAAIGSGADSTFLIEGRRTDLALPDEVPSQEDLFRVGLALNPRVNALREQVVGAEARIVAAKRDGLPTISISAGQYRTATPPNESSVAQDVTGWSVGIQVRIPLFDGFRQRSNVDTLTAQLEQKKSELEIAERDAELAIWSVQEDLQKQRKKLQHTAKILTIAKMAADAAKVRYTQGVGNMLELLKSEADWIDARRANIRTEADLDLAKIRFVLQTKASSEVVVQ